MSYKIIKFKKEEEIDDKSIITNCFIKPKKNEKNFLFTNYGGEKFIVKLDGYAIIPLEEYNKLNNSLINKIKKYLGFIS